MASEKVGKSRLFIIASFIFISAMILIYGGRFVYFYKLTHVETKAGTTLLSSAVKSSTNSGSVKTDGKDIYYTGNILNNYVYYSGRYYRILGVYEEKIVMVDNEISTILPYNNDELGKSDIYKWLNTTDVNNTGIYYNSLNNPEKYLDKTRTCIDVYNAGNSILKCNKYNEANIGILSIYDYMKATNGESNYLNINSYYWLANQNNDNYKWYIDNNNKTSIRETPANYGVRAVITLKPEVIYNGGSGTMYDPYIITDEDGKILANSEEIDYSNKSISNGKIGSYISYSGKLWKIMNIDDEKIKVLLNESLESKAFSKKTNIYDLKDKTGIAYYLNNTYYNSLENKDYLVKGDFYIGEYKDSYLNIYDKKVSCYVGTLEIGNLFVGDISEVFTLTNTGLEETVYKVINGRLYADSYENENEIRPIIYLKSSLIIKSGYGTIDAPYEVGEA